MIFLSHNHQDKQIVEQFAIPLLEALGQDQVFYDSWSIQPGDGIIERMNAGLSDATLFLFFVSKKQFSEQNG
ncbi:toll/interleukin-1 receptor domain-containing protein [Brucella oryzae]|uniref:toll/interleukin-1 receptor domain-containing protein n=1 Tax=Brucella oryzae TaxID=335286 RepID=UPI001B83427E|nr:toll/interleukin-1 receptor domain-containing protein [Brucella oryzae]MBR7654524.1 toll/interleukin-1 receptor domain-containing protein [Brucella oryzae]